MPLYELVCVTARNTGKAVVNNTTQSYSKMKSLTTTSTSLILANGGVVRNLDYYGYRNLPQKMKRGDGESLVGDYWTMKFDANPPTVAVLNERLKLDPLVLRWTTLKIGSTLTAITEPNKTSTIKFNRSNYEAEAPEPENRDFDYGSSNNRNGIPGRR